MSDVYGLEGASVSFDGDSESFRSPRTPRTQSLDDLDALEFIERAKRNYRNKYVSMKIRKQRHVEMISKSERWVVF